MATIKRCDDDMLRAAADGAGPQRLSSTARFAVYLAPSGPFDALGRQWLGRDAQTGQALARDWVAGLASDDMLFGAGGDAGQDVITAATVDAWTDDPRRYGLHATMKPPFRLAHGRSAFALDQAVRVIATSTTPFDLPLRLGSLRGFLAWQPADTVVAQGPLQRLADQCVARLDAFRAAPTDAERARRMARGEGKDACFDVRQQANLDRWGYPYVFDTFHFHVTLTRRLTPEAEARARRALMALAVREEAGGRSGMVTALTGAVMPVRTISIFVQPETDAPFVVARHYDFDGGVQDGVGAWALSDTTESIETEAGRQRAQ
ncbi:DUF1045 domain-containing protein [Robbsia andropogonis]|nr:DUF1045 domain-containing protein [Robbsia andropogonis]MCP1118105.1 DUF1045 domain-containing protein [Robbsia andropogonis]MCP1127614.1 DUF1045 domain-containing protein [Robbsia andropogonis]